MLPGALGLLCACEGSLRAAWQGARAWKAKPGFELSHLLAKSLKDQWHKPLAYSPVKWGNSSLLTTGGVRGRLRGLAQPLHEQVLIQYSNALAFWVLHAILPPIYLFLSQGVLARRPAGNLSPNYFPTINKGQEQILL